MKNCVRNLSCLLAGCLLAACDLNKPLEPFIQGQSWGTTNKQIMSFAVTPAGTGIKYWGVIDESGKTVTVTVPVGTALTNMGTAIFHTGQSISPASGTPQNFSSSGTTRVPYTVSPADGSGDAVYGVAVIEEGIAPPKPAGSWAAYRPAGNGGLGKFYPTLEDAVNEAAGTAANPDAIILVGNDSITSTITISGGKYIRLTSPVNTISINRASGYTGSLITVAANASLELGGYLAIDGGSANTTPLTAAAALITVNGSGTLKMGGSAELRNNNNNSSNGGGVYVNGGTFTMSDSAKISNNTTAVYGGGVYVFDGGFFTMTGGTIESNSAVQGGGLYITGTNSAPSYFSKTGGTIYGDTGTQEENIATGPPPPLPLQKGTSVMLVAGNGGTTGPKNSTKGSGIIGTVKVDYNIGEDEWLDDPPP